MKQAFFHFTALSLFTFSTASMATPEVIIKNASNMKQLFSPASVPLVIQPTLKNIIATQPNLYKIIAYQFPDHYVLYLLSNKNWHVEKIRVDIDANHTPHLTPSYHENSDELKILAQNTTVSPPVCPDNSVEFVAISSYPDLGDITKAIHSVTQVAQQKYKTVEILSATDANAQTYENWFSCPNLKVFYSIGHGSEDGIIFADGDYINSDFFTDPAFNHKYQHTTVLINSCNVFDDPFGTEMTFGSAMTKTDFTKAPGPTAYEFIGGYAELAIGASEDVSACFLISAMHGAPMNYATLKNCIGNYDVYYHSFGISAPGRRLSST